MIATEVPSPGNEDVWRALANPARRELLDALKAGPRTTGELAQTMPAVSQFAVMQHLAVLEAAGLVIGRRRGRQRFNYINPVPLQEWYERWVTPLAGRAAAEAMAIKRVVESDDLKQGGEQVSITAPEQLDVIRTVRIETELRFKASPERVFDVIVARSNEWYPYTYGEERVKAIVLEPRVGGRYFEDWGDGQGHLYGVVSHYDAPTNLAYRGQIYGGSILDTEYELERDGNETILRVHKVAVGPMTEQDAAGIHRRGDLANFEADLRKFIEN